MAVDDADAVEVAITIVDGALLVATLDDATIGATCGEACPELAEGLAETMLDIKTGVLDDAMDGETIGVILAVASVDVATSAQAMLALNVTPSTSAVVKVRVMKVVVFIKFRWLLSVGR